jgi:hypothetical protein
MVFAAVSHPRLAVTPCALEISSQRVVGVNKNLVTIDERDVQPLADVFLCLTSALMGPNSGI